MYAIINNWSKIPFQLTALIQMVRFVKQIKETLLSAMRKLLLVSDGVVYGCKSNKRYKQALAELGETLFNMVLRI